MKLFLVFLAIFTSGLGMAELPNSTQMHKQTAANWERNNAEVYGNCIKIFESSIKTESSYGQFNAFITIAHTPFAVVEHAIEVLKSKGYKVTYEVAEGPEDVNNTYFVKVSWQ